MNNKYFSTEGLKGLIIFSVANYQFCADIKDLAAIIRPSEVNIFHENGMEDEIKFYKINFKVIKLQQNLTSSQFRITDKTRILLFEISRKQFCFFADEVIEIITPVRFFFEKSLEIMPYSDQNFAVNKLRYQDREFYLPNYDNIVKSLETHTVIKSESSYQRNLYNIAV